MTISAKAKSVAFTLLMLAAVCLFIALTTGCVSRWDAGYETPIDWHKPVNEIPGQFRAGIGGEF